MKKSKVIFLALLACAFGASARTVNHDEAVRAARLWTARGTRLGSRIGGLVRNVVAYNTNSLPAFYAVEFAKGGTVFTSANTENEPILAFAKDAPAQLDANSPLAALLYGRAANESASQANQKKWKKVLSARTIRLATYSNPFLGASEIPIEGIDEIDDLRVAPLTKTKWAQSEAYSASNLTATVKCFDYYTPAESVVRNYSNGTIATNVESTVCGCVATAMAQLMKYWEYPAGACESFTNSCSWPTNSVLREYYSPLYEANRWTQLSGDTVSGILATEGGTYAWADMTDYPLARYKKGDQYQWFGQPVTEANRQAVGKLTYDCGVAVGMDYGLSATGGSGILATDADRISNALREKFAYTNALLNTAESGLSAQAVSKSRQNTILANLDAGCPVMLNITGSSGGHAVVGDGYGYSGEEEDAYVHLNMGWSGQCDVWYNLPLISTSTNNPEGFTDFNTIVSVVYNVFPTSEGEIVSGQVMTNDADGVAHPVAGIAVTATDNLGKVYETTASEYGVYAFIVPAGRSYRIYAALPADAIDKKIGEVFTDVISASVGSTVGNSWGNDITLDYPTVRIGDRPYVSLDRALDEVADGDAVEILRPTELRKAMTIMNDCMIVATNDDPTASAIVRIDDAQIEIANGATVAVSNVAFAVEYETTIVVSEGGVLKVGGYCGLGSVWTSAATNLVVEAGLTNSSFAVCCANAMGKGQTFAIGSAGLDYAVATNCANRMLHYSNTRLGGEAFTNAAGEIFFNWSSKAHVPDEVAVGRLNGENYRSLTDICEDVIAWDIDADIVLLKDAAFTNYFCGARHYTFRSANGRCTVKPSSTAGFAIPTDGSLTISNLVFSGYADANLTDMAGFICVKGGELIFEDGAELNGIEGNVPERSGVVDVLAGTLNMHSGSAIVNCKAKGGKLGKGNGGALYSFATNSCVLNLEGGTITSCTATKYGGGVYVYDNYGKSATVNLSGDITIAGNTSDSANGADDLCLSTVRALPHFRLKGNLSGKVGIRYATKVAALGFSGNEVGDPFVTSEVAAHSPATLAAFFNDTNPSLVANVSGDKLVWAIDPRDPRQCSEDEAAAKLIAGKAVTFWKKLSDALNEATNNCIVEVLRDTNIVENVTINNGANVTLRSSAAAAYGFNLYRDKDVSIKVPAGSSLSVTNVEFHGYAASVEWSKGPLFDVEGGTLKIDNVGISNVLGDGDRNANAITVYNNGVFEMRNSTITRCLNYSTDPSGVKDVNAGAGGGLLVENASAYLCGGFITGCSATKGGGVKVCNSAKVYLSDHMCIYDNVFVSGAANNIEVSDDSQLIVEEELTGRVYVTPKTLSLLQPGDTNVIATVGFVWANRFATLTNSAASFKSDVSHDVGVAVTNGTKALIVWSQSLKNGGYARLEDGKLVRYALAGLMPDIRQCDRDDEYLALARIVDEKGAATYWWRVDDALGEATNGCVVEVFGDDVLSKDIVIRGTNVTLRSADYEEFGFYLYRNRDVSIKIPSKCELAVNRVEFAGDIGDGASSRAFFDVCGGKLGIDDVGIYDVAGTGASAASAIAVSDDGVFAMTNSQINACTNGVAGGGLLVDGSTAYLLDGYISGCRAPRGGGVFACNGATVFVGGHMCVCDNETADGMPTNNVTLADTADLILTNALTGLVYMTPRSGEESGLAAHVGYVWTNDIVALTNSAAGFVNDADGDVGMAVTNGTKALIVWCGAVKNGVYTNVSDGVEYRPIDVVSPLPMLPPLTSEAEVTGEMAKLADATAAAKITTLDEYNDFCAWADDVEGGKDAVAASPNAYVSYEFGTTNLFENMPVVGITEVVGVDGGLTVSVVVKDGEDVMAVASAKVKELFEGTTDVSDWTTESKKLDLAADGVTTDRTNAMEKEVEFTIKPTGNPSGAFIRLKY